MLAHRGPAAEERGQLAAGGMRFFTCLALPQGGDWGNACLPSACFSRGAGLQRRVSLTGADGEDHQSKGGSLAVRVGDSEGHRSTLRHRLVMGGAMGHRLGRQSYD